MDRAADVTYIDITHTLNTTTAFLSRLAEIKGVRVEMAELNARIAPALVYRGVQVEGLWPAADYLMDVRPYPNVLPESVSKRAVMRSCVEMLLTDPKRLGDLYTLYADDTGKIRLPGRQTTILDLAVASFAHTLACGTFPWVQELVELVDRRTDCHEPVHCLECV